MLAFDYDPVGRITLAKGFKGERGFTGSPFGTANPFKHMKPHPTNPNKVIYTDPHTGKKIEKPKPPNFDKQGGLADPEMLELLIPWWATPIELGCGELDCDHDEIPDNIEFDHEEEECP